MKRPKICAVIVDKDLAALKDVERFVAFFEVRIDLVGDSWQELARQLKRPWIAANRNQAEGGRWKRSEEERIKELLIAAELGASIIDIELETGGLAEIVKSIKKGSKCILSYHNLERTPPLDELKEIVQKQLAAGADICKVVTTAQKFEDNITVLRLFSEFPKVKIISFAMGTLGLVSRILCPLVGGFFTYASIEEGKESAPGQIKVMDLYQIYSRIVKC